MTDVHSKEIRSKNMAAIHGKNTKLELGFFELLDESRIEYQKHPDIYGKPDCLVGNRIVIFIDSDFWHGWKFSEWKSRMPNEYWVEKITKNIKRDKLKFKLLKKDGYIVIRVWEHTLTKNPSYVITRIREKMKQEQYNGTNTSCL